MPSPTDVLGPFSVHEQCAVFLRFLIDEPRVRKRKMELSGKLLSKELTALGPKSVTASLDAFERDSGPPPLPEDLLFNQVAGDYRQ